MLKLVRENPALFLGELREDLERIHAIDTITGERHLIKVRGDENDNGCIETLIPFPNNVEFDIL